MILQSIMNTATPLQVIFFQNSQPDPDLNMISP